MMAASKKEIDWAYARQRAAEMFAEAVKNGTHGPTPFLCEVCREWVEAIYYVGFDGRRMCLFCAAVAEVKGAREHLQKFDHAGFARLVAREKAAYVK